MDKLFPAFEENNIAIAFASNDAFVPYMATMIRSIIANGSEENNYDFVILHSGIGRKNAALLQEMVSPFANVSLRLADVTDEVAGYTFFTGGKDNFTKEAYYRLLIPELMGEYEKVLYLDGDMVALTDVAELYRTNLEDALLASSRDLCGLIQYYNPLADLKKYRDEVLNLTQPEDYFIDGMVLFNILAFRAAFTTRKLLDFAASRQWRSHDQDVLNVLCEGRVKLVDAAWDVMKPEMIEYLPPARREELERSIAAPKIVHFAGLLKPWLYLDAPFSREFWQYAAQTPYIEEIIRRRLLLGGLPNSARFTMEREFREGKAGARYILRYAKAWLAYKLHRG